MKHNINELYHINGQKLYTEDYIKANNIQQRDRRSLSNEGWTKAHAEQGSGKDQGKTVYTANGNKRIYLYGEKTFFDTQEERDAYREQMNQEREQERRRNKALRTINDYLATLSTDDLEDLIKGLN